MDAPTDLAPVYTRGEGDLLVPSSRAQGPWHPDSQHGGCIAGLLARAAEAVPTAQPMRPARFTLELYRRCPKVPLHTTSEVLREGRRLQVVDTVLWAGEVDVARARTVKLREDAAVLHGVELPPVPPEDRAPPTPAEGIEFPLGPDGSMDFFDCFSTSIVSEYADGEPSDHITCWYRLDHPLVEGEPTSPFVRLAATGDMAMSATWWLGWGSFSAPNVDLTIQSLRLPDDPWIALDCKVRIDPDGSAQSDAVIHDLNGRLGHLMKSLLVDSF